MAILYKDCTQRIQLLFSLTSSQTGRLSEAAYMCTIRESTAPGSAFPHPLSEDRQACMGQLRTCWWVAGMRSVRCRNSLTVAMTTAELECDSLSSNTFMTSNTSCSLLGW